MRERKEVQMVCFTRDKPCVVIYTNKKNDAFKSTSIIVDYKYSNTNLLFFLRWPKIKHQHVRLVNRFKHILLIIISKKKKGGCLLNNSLTEIAIRSMIFHHSIEASTFCIFLYIWLKKSACKSDQYSRWNSNVLLKCDKS